MFASHRVRAPGKFGTSAGSLELLLEVWNFCWKFGTSAGSLCSKFHIQLTGFKTRMASSDAGRRILWLSLDPVNATLVPYPPPINQQIESAHEKLEPEQGQQERIALGSSFHHATIHFSPKDGKHFQTTPQIDHGPRFGVKISGYRQVRRMEIEPSQTSVILHAATHNGLANGEWRLVEEDKSMKRVSMEIKQEFLINVGSNQRKDFVPVWQWCKQNEEELQGVHVTHAPESAWGIYMIETNEAIEAAFRAGKSSQEVVLGVHRVIIEMSESGVGVQKDLSGRRQRFVRRQLVSEQDKDRMFSASAKCRHVFHACCCQSLKERRMPCPLCRRQIE
ncbi:hypothetical protein GUITHDRAFT_136873 [Guillardia theta CCMP2712]|uniref:RING-type domain-containing protein n=1 Tax=Guillardia theta (strain CCMP2712) TaxID=905079 RepID=L1JJ92_GUITC|nr:hypothetical protein GUITHDRAFT_136873 [Guillardia theta CCMP2712]EKX48367.1 hypothetical protein GUITHDRAFT_136873 [Guillardia theta CCMP2712]|eukprot:XP_005835347.1 hypothetical protein GUITHDRAFT_136873 [Guillardia theta CCMP2712]